MLAFLFLFIYIYYLPRFISQRLNLLQTIYRRLYVEEETRVLIQYIIHIHGVRIQCTHIRIYYVYVFIRNI